MKSQKRLFIVGAGSFGRELSAWLSFDDMPWSDYAFAGFLEDNARALEDYPSYQPGVVSRIGDYQPAPGDGLLMGIADPRVKLEIGRALVARGGNFLTFVHPSALISRNVTVGRGVVICPHVVVSCDARIEDFVAINLSCTVGHDVKLGAGCTLSAHVDVTGFAVLDEGVFLGSHASILPRATIGAYARVGAGTVVLRSAKAGSTVMGVPAKQILP